jgi:hypothetical protein
MSKDLPKDGVKDHQVIRAVRLSLLTQHSRHMALTRQAHPLHNRLTGANHLMEAINTRLEEATVIRNFFSFSLSSIYLYNLEGRKEHFTDTGLSHT